MEPGSTSAAGAAAGWKLIGGLAGLGAFFAGLSAVVVMSMSETRSRREWRVALISTVVSSIGGGAAVAQHFGLQHWVDSYVGWVALGGLLFACGLPGWVLVRSFFAWADKRREADLAEIIQEVRENL